MIRLGYHMVTPRHLWGINRVTPGQFQRQVQLALDLNFELSTLHTALCEDHPRRMVLTFDDGYENVYEHAYPILSEHKRPATIYILPTYMGRTNRWDFNWFGQTWRHLSREQLKELIGAGWEVGSHGLSHRDLTRLSDHRCLYELKRSRDLLQQTLGVAVRSVAYPFGNVTPRVARLAQEAGYDNGVVMATVPSGVEPQYSLTRMGVYLWDTLWTVRQKCVGNHSRIFNLYQRGVDFCSNGTVYVKQGFKRSR